MRVLLGLRLLFDIVLCQSFIQHFTVLVKRVGFEEIVVVRLVVYLALLFHDIPWYMKGVSVAGDLLLWLQCNRSSAA